MRTNLDYDARNALLVDQTKWLSQPFLEFQTPKRTKISANYICSVTDLINVSLSAAQLSVCVTALRAEFSEKKHEQ